VRGERLGTRLTSCDRSVAVDIALLPLRDAHAFTAILAAVEEIVVRYLGGEVFALVESDEQRWRVVIAHGVDEDEIARLSGSPCIPAGPALAWCPLRGGNDTLGWLAIYELTTGKYSLDAFDVELIEALGPFVAVALEEARELAAKPTVRPPSMSKVRTK